MRVFELTTVRFGPDPRPIHGTFESGRAAASSLLVPDDAECFVRASVTEGNVSWGEFELWCSGSRARARILEHREHDASDPDSPRLTGSTVVFKEEDGSTFSEPFDLTVPRLVAIVALRAWLVDLKPPDMLQWS